MSRVILMEGPDGCGKTEIGKRLAFELDLSYFKVVTEAENWRNGNFLNALRFDQTYLAQFLRQVRCDVVIDRAYPSEFVYSKVFGRKTDMDVLRSVDEQFSWVGVTIVLCLRTSYADNRPDTLVPAEKLPELHQGYLEFMEWTKCNVIALYVDTFGNSLDQETFALVPELNVSEIYRDRPKHKRVIVLKK